MSRLPIGNLVDLARLRADTAGDARACGFLADGERETEMLSYAELDRRARLIASVLRATTAPGSTVVLAYPPGLEFVCAFFACVYAGKVAVPVCPPHPRKGNERLVMIAADAQAQLMLTTTTGALCVELAAQHTPALAAMTVVATDAIATSATPADLALSPPGESIAFIQYTSGSTMRPRGVLVSHANVLANLAAIHRAEGNSAHSRGVSWLPSYHDMGLIEGILEPIYGGYPTWLMPPAAFLQKPQRWLRAISRYRATVSGGPNFAYELCVRRVSDAALAGVDLTSWRVAYCGAEPVRAATLRAFAARFASYGLARAALRPVYGLAEATLLVTASAQAAPGPRIVRSVRSSLEQGRFVAAGADCTQSVEIVSCGTPPAGTSVAIVDVQTGAALPDGSIGEILVRGPAVTRGYRGASQGTADDTGEQRLHAMPSRWLHTGDLGFLLDGELFVCGRRKDLIVLRGRKLHPQDIEQTVHTLAADHAIEAAAAFAVEHADAEQLVVCAEIARGAIGRQCGNALAATADAVRVAVYREHDVAIASVAFVRAGLLPRTTSGKLMRYRAREQFASASLALLARFDAPSFAPACVEAR